MELEELNFDNILNEDQIENLFEQDEDIQETPPEQQETKETNNKESNKENNQEINQEPHINNEEATEVDAENLFDEPEEVGSEDKEKEDTNSEKVSTSPNSKNFFSSIAKAFAEEGIFPDLNEDEVANIKTAESFRELIDKQIQSQLDEKQKRIDEALNVGIEPDDIRKYENTLAYLDEVTDSKLEEETTEGEELRKRLIYQDYINKGFSQERATKEVKRSIDSGNDIEDAKEALNSNKEHFKTQYNKLLNDAKEEQKKYEQERRNQAEQLKKSIIEEKKIFGDIEVDKTTRQKIFDNLSKPIYKDEETGNYMTALQKYQHDNPNEFIKNVSTIFTLTDGFKNLNKLVKGKVNKEIKKGFRDLENVLNNTARNSDGNINFASGVDDENSMFKGYKFDF